MEHGSLFLLQPNQAMTSVSNFNVASNVFFLLFPFWLVLAGALSRYRFQILGLLLTTLTSIWYHLCWSHEAGYCAGKWDASGKDIWLSRDVLTAHLSVLLTTSVLADQLWFKHSAHGERFMDAFILGGSLATFFLVWFMRDSPVTTIVLAIMNLLVLGYALYSETRRVSGHSWWWYFRGGLALCMILVASVIKVIANTHEYSYYTSSQTDAYNLEHAFWHTLVGIGTFLLATLLDDLVNSAFGWTPSTTKVTSYVAVSKESVKI